MFKAVRERIKKVLYAHGRMIFARRRINREAERVIEFDYRAFPSDLDTLAVSKERYTKEQAIDIAKAELESISTPYYIAVGSGYARRRGRLNKDRGCSVDWRLEYIECTKSCPCWVFHKARDPEHDSRLFKGYEYIHITEVTDTVQ